MLFTFSMIFEILLERSAGRLELQCNQAWYSLERKFIKPGFILKKKYTESMQFGGNLASFERHCYTEMKIENICVLSIISVKRVNASLKY